MTTDSGLLESFIALSITIHKFTFAVFLFTAGVRLLRIQVGGFDKELRNLISEVSKLLSRR